MNATDAPLVSIILAVKNGERFIAEAINSLLAQTYRTYEIIVIDGQSDDRTAEIVQSFSEIRYFRQADFGLANGRNFGIKIAQGQLIAFLDHDDLWLSYKLQKQVQHLIQHPELRYVISQVQFFSESNFRPRPGFRAHSFESSQAAYTPSALLAHKDVFKQIGNFDPAFKVACDIDWFTRAQDHKIPMTILPDILLRKRIHQVNLSSNVEVNRRELMRVVKQSLDRRRQLTH